MGLLDGLIGPAGSDERLKLKIGLMGMTHRPNAALMNMWGGELQQSQATKAEAAKVNKTAQYLRSLGTAQAMQAAAALEAGSIDASTAYAEATKPAPQVDPWAGTKEIGGDLYRMGANGPELVLDAAGADTGGPTYGLTPQRYVRPDGTMGLGVLGNDGTFKEVALPDGAQPAPNVDKIDAGDRWLLIDQMGNKIGEEMKNIEDAAAAQTRGAAIGEAQGAAITGEGSAVQAAQQGIALIDSIIKDPALDSITGMVQGQLPPLTQAGTDLNVKIKQVQGQAFLQAFESLKGGGAITEREGQAATEAVARLNRAQSSDEYRRALAELQGILKRGLANAQSKASAARGEAPAAVNDDPLGLFQ